MSNANFPGFDSDDEPKPAAKKPAAKPASAPAAPAFEFEESAPKPKKPAAEKPAAAGNVNPFADQAVQVNPVLGVQGDADGGGDRQLVLLDLQGHQRSLQQLVGHFRRTRRIGIGQQQDKLVATQPGYRVLLSHHSFEPVGQRNQH